MLKYLPEQPLVRWALGAVAVVGAGSIAYVLLFPAARPLPEPADLSAPAALTDPAPPAEPAALSDPAPPAEPAALAEPDAQPALPTPSALSDDPGAGGLPLEDTAPEMQTAMSAPLAGLAPSFDLVRITDLGDVLIAGRAPASSAVAALIDEDPVAQAVSSRAGEFVMMFTLDPHPAPRVLELEVRLPSGDRVRSQDTLMLAPRSPALPEDAAPEGLALDQDVPQPRQMARAVDVAPLFPDSTAPAPDRTQDSADLPGTAAPAAPGSAPDTAQDIARAPQPAQGNATLPDSPAPAPPDTVPNPAEDIARAPGPVPDSADAPDLAADAPAARTNAPPMAMLLRADGGVQLLDPAPELPGVQATTNVTIDSVVYDAEGEIAISGRSQEGAADIQIYLDNQPILRARAASDGNWQAQLAGIERGVYRLRVDELDAAAQVISRAEIPFERVTPEIARAAGGPQALIVQPGNTLWGMSAQQFGDGRRYMRIFDANRDQIRDPDLIFPGQVFILPEAGD